MYILHSTGERIYSSKVLFIIFPTIMGYRGIDNQEIKVDIKNKKVAQSIVDNYLKDLPADKKQELQNSLNKIDADRKTAESKVVAGTVKDLHDLKNNIMDYGRLVSDNIRMDLLQAKLKEVSHTFSTNGDLTDEQIIKTE